MEELEIKDDNSINHTESIGLLAGIINIDSRWLLINYASLVALPILLRLLNLESMTLLIIAFFVQQLVELRFLITLGERTIKKCSDQFIETQELPKNYYRNYYLLGLSLWCLLKLPQIIMQASIKDNLVVALSVISLFGLVINFRFITFPSSFILQRVSSLSNIKALSFAGRYTEKNRFLAIRLLLIPFILHYLLDSILSIFDPVGKNIYILFLKDASSGIYFLLASLFIISYSIIARPKQAGLDYQHLNSLKIKTLQNEASKSVKNKFSWKNTIRFFVIILFINFANTVRVMTEKPAFTVKLEQVEVNNSDVILKLDLEDQEYKFRGMQYLLFRLASENKTPISSFPRIKSLEEQETKRKVQLIFNTELKSKHLKTLKDLYLYYGDNKVSLLPMDSATDLPK